MTRRIWAVVILFFLSGNGYCLSPHNLSSKNGVVDTGQTTKYSIAYGDDSDYRPAGLQAKLSLKIIGTSTVTIDNATGLVWVYSPIDAGFNPGPSLWEMAISSCEALSYAGFTDWRLPSFKELVSICNFSAAPCFDGSYFINPKGTETWYSGTTSPADKTRALTLSYFGNTGAGVKSSFYGYVRCVRGGLDR